MAAALVATHSAAVGSLALPGWAQVSCGVVAGFGIGVVAAIVGVAGGELLIPTVVLLFAVDIKVAGSLSLLVSLLPTMLVAFAPLQPRQQLRGARRKLPLHDDHDRRLCRGWGRWAGSCSARSQIWC
ncbi:hypothetical protein [Streptomyces sp. NPDC056192]|uniref:hypothetical protein n=1 Tax=Streptomyces sp. NPDC056192 TaxID=3345743 RepID=UPI0035DC0661